MKYKYKGITFSKELNCSLEDFIKTYASYDIFKEIPHLDRDAELKKVHKAVMKHNGFNTPVPKKSKSNKTKSSKA